MDCCNFHTSGGHPQDRHGYDAAAIVYCIATKTSSPTNKRRSLARIGTKGRIGARRISDQHPMTVDNCIICGKEKQIRQKDLDRGCMVVCFDCFPSGGNLQISL